MKLNKKHIPLFAVIVQTAQYALAGYFLIGVMGWFFVGLMGALVSMALAYATSQFADIARARKKSSFIAMLLIMSFSPILIGTATWVHLTVIANPYWRGVVSLVWGALPDLAVALAGFIAGKGLVEQSDRPRPAQRNEQSVKGRSAKASGRSKSLSVSQVTIACRYAPQCGRSFTKDTTLKATNAANAHARTCKFKPIETVLPVELQKIEKKA